MKNEIPLSVPVIQGNEWRYIKECLDTGWVSSVGNYVERFESFVTDYVGSKYGVAIVNGTSALHVSLLTCGIGAGDKVIVPALTFIAPVNAVKYCGASPIFIDCDPETLCIDVKKVIEFVKRNNSKIKAIIPVHVFGHPTDMDDLIKVCSDNNIIIIEDATESLGSEYKDRKTGTFGKVGCFSFNGNKIITTGGGGMVVTEDKVLADEIRHLTTQANRCKEEYEHDEIGYNYRLTNIQAAMGVAQMEKLDEYIQIKRKNALFYKEQLSEVDDIEFLWEKPWVKNNFWFYTIKIPGRHKKPLMDFLISENIQVRPVWKLINTLPMYRDCQTYRIEHALTAYNTCLNLPCSINLKQEEIEFVVSSIKKYFSRCTLKR